MARLHNNGSPNMGSKRFDTERSEVENLVHTYLHTYVLTGMYLLYPPIYNVPGYLAYLGRRRMYVCMYFQSHALLSCQQQYVPSTSIYMYLAPFECRRHSSLALLTAFTKPPHHHHQSAPPWHYWVCRVDSQPIPHLSPTVLYWYVCMNETSQPVE